MSQGTQKNVAVFGGGPAGLMAAERICAAGFRVDLYDTKSSVGRKFLIAGKGGLNLTHSEPFDAFVQRYANRQPQITEWLKQFDANALRDWVSGFGIETFIGSSGRVFPEDLKAAPLLRAWVRRLREAGVRFHMQHRWLGWNADLQSHNVQTSDGHMQVQANAAVLALGGGSWAKLGSDGLWVSALQQHGVDIANLQASNCGFEVAWTPYFQNKFSGTPLKSIGFCVLDENGREQKIIGECVITEAGIEGSAVYALSAILREQINQQGSATLVLDLTPNKSLADIQRQLTEVAKQRSLSEKLRRAANVSGVKAGLLYEVLSKAELSDTLKLAQTIKALPLQLLRTRPIDEAISSAGGVCFSAINSNLMLNKIPSVFCAGEMIDWEAPTGGYLLTASFASGVVAAQGVIDYLHTSQTPET